VRSSLALIFFVLVISGTFVESPWSQVSIAGSTGQTNDQFGPRVDSVLVKLYEGNVTRLQQDLEIGETDIADWELSQEYIEKWSQAPYNATIEVAEYPISGMHELDINNNGTIVYYPNWRSPTSYPEFRHAIAHLVDKTRIVAEILEGHGIEMPAPVMPWLEEWFNPVTDPHSYNPEEAATLLDAAGFVKGSTPNPNYDSTRAGSARFWRVYPPDHEKAGQDIDELLFYVRTDKPERNATAFLIQKELLNIGLPVRMIGPVRIQEFLDKIWIYRDFHLYTGAWSLDPEPDYLYTLYHSSNYWPMQSSPNFNNVNDSELNHWLEILIDALDKNIAKTACFEAQRRLAEIVGVIPLWCPTSTKAYRRTSERAPSGWTGLVNQKNFGVDSEMTFLNIHRIDIERGGIVKYGLSSYIDKLNPIDPQMMGDSVILSKLYNSMLQRNPHNLSLEPCLAQSFDSGTWLNAESGRNCCKLTFHLRNDAYWHDGEHFTSEDVEFTINYLRQYGEWPAPWIYYLVSDIHHVDVSDPNTITLYIDVPGYWPLYTLGELPIIPKHIWEDMSAEDALGEMPDINLIGTGPFKFNSSAYVPNEQIVLDRNELYFAQSPIDVFVATSTNRVEPYQSVEFSVQLISKCSDETLVGALTIKVDDALVVAVNDVILSSLASYKTTLYDTGMLSVGKHEITAAFDILTPANRSALDKTYVQEVYVTISADLNYDFCVNAKDAIMIGLAFGSKHENLKWNPRADMNSDGYVNAKDAILLGTFFNWPSF